jgi:hypothetical protein
MSEIIEIKALIDKETYDSIVRMELTNVEIGKIIKNSLNLVDYGIGLAVDDFNKYGNTLKFKED